MVTACLLYHLFKMKTPFGESNHPKGVFLILLLNLTDSSSIIKFENNYEDVFHD